MLQHCNSKPENETALVNTILCGMFIGAIAGILFGAVFGNLTIGIAFGPLLGALGGLIYTIVRARQTNKR